MVNVTYNGDNCLHILVKKLRSNIEANNDAEIDAIIECIRMLIEEKCDLRMKDGDERTAFEYLMELKETCAKTAKINFMMEQFKERNVAEIEKVDLKTIVDEGRFQDFRFALDNFETNDSRDNIFAHVLSVPSKEEFIVECMKYGVDLYKVS